MNANRIVSEQHGITADSGNQVLEMIRRNRRSDIKKKGVICMENIVHGSKNQIDSKRRIRFDKLAPK